MIDISVSTNVYDTLIKMITNLMNIDYEFAVERQQNYIAVFSYNYKFKIHYYDNSTCIQIESIGEEKISNKDFIHLHKILNGIQ